MEEVAAAAARSPLVFRPAVHPEITAARMKTPTTRDSTVQRGGNVYTTCLTSAKWQATGWPWPRSISAGSSSAQMSCAFQQRVRNRQPDGGSTGLGTSPSSTIRWRCALLAGSGTGTADSSAWV